MIDFNGVSVSYPDGTQALSDLNFHIDKGESTAIVGANGAGKSTLLLTAVGILLPSGGKITVNGIDVNKQNLRKLREQAGLVFQNPDDQLFTTSVYEDVAFGPRNLSLSKTEIDSRVDEMLNALDIAHLKDKMPQKLSGGEKRRAALAAVLAMRPSVLLLDEPSSFLDPRARKGLISVLARQTVTKLVATHDLDLALSLCEHVIILKNGRICAIGKSKDILTDEKLLIECGLELPLSMQK